MSNDAIAQTRHYYRTHGRNMDEDMRALLHNPRGVLVYTPDLVVLAKQVRREEELLWGVLDDAPEEADSWYIHLLAGRLSLARQWAAALPKMEWCCFHRGSRNGKPHIVPWFHICSLCRNQ